VAACALGFGLAAVVRTTTRLAAHARNVRMELALGRWQKLAQRFHLLLSYTLLLQVLYTLCCRCRPMVDGERFFSPSLSVSLSLGKRLAGH
jgi:hypothetical protein